MSERLPWIAALAGLWLACIPAPPPAIPPSQMLGHLHDGLSPQAQEVLQRRAATDTTLADWLADYGPPDYLAVPSDRSLILFHVARDLEAHFDRPFLAAQSEPPRTQAIRAPHHRFFSNDDRERLAELRRERAREEERTRRERARAARERSSVPAAPED